MLSHTCKAAIKAVVFLGFNSLSEKKSGILEVAQHIHENEHTVGKLLQKLAKADLIKSAKGPNGGFYLSPEQQDQAVIEIVVFFDGYDLFEKCGMGLHTCSETKPCPFHHDYKPIREQFEKMLSENRIRDLYKDMDNGLSFLAD